MTNYKKDRVVYRDLHRHMHGTRFHSALTTSEEEYICHPAVLKAWQHRSLAQRVVLIQRELGRVICERTVANYYKRNQIRYLRPLYTYHRQRDKVKHNQAQRDFIFRFLPEFYSGR